VSLGDYVTTSSPLVSLQTVDPIRASFQVPERYARDVAVGQQVRFRVAALPGEEFTGTVDFVDPVVQLPGRTILVKARVANRNGRLQSGMFIEARLATEVRASAVVIPEEAIVPLQGVNFVWVVQDQKASRREVVLGVRTPGFVEIRSGVEPGEQVVTGGQARLQPGAPVQPIPVDRAPQGGGEVPDTGSGASAPDSAGGGD
jgi:membrane fusion protein (multidrug efflux system)